MKILIADDHAVLREGVKSLLNSMPFVTSIDEAADGNQTLSMIKNNDYDMAILDISMPGISGLDILRDIRDLECRCRILIMSFHPEEHYAGRVFKLGAVGYVSKCASFEEVRQAIEKVAAGGRYVSANYAEKLAFTDVSGVNTHHTLSDREFQVMISLAKGSSISDIARDAFLSDKTVSTYRGRIMKKMNFKSNADLTIYALQKGLIN